MLPLKALEIGGGKLEAVDAELSVAMVDASFGDGADDLGDGGLKVLGRIGKNELAGASRVEREIVEAAELAATKRGLRTGTTVGEDVVAARSSIGVLVVVVQVSTLPTPTG